jgi:hypothetical protein
MSDSSHRSAALSGFLAIALAVVSTMVTARELAGGADEGARLPGFRQPSQLSQAYLEAERARWTLHWIETFLKAGPASEGDLRTISVESRPEPSVQN